MTAVRPPARFGRVQIESDSSVSLFEEKPATGSGLINGGFFVLQPSVLEMIKDDDESFEHDTLPRLASDKELCAYAHHGFWQPMDTLRDKTRLDDMWKAGEAPWKIWDG